METSGLPKRLTEIIEKIRVENEKLSAQNSSYLWLLDVVTKIKTIDELMTEADRILYFLADTYEGDKEINAIVGNFVLHTVH